MSSTDRAFIDAYRRATSSNPTQTIAKKSAPHFVGRRSRSERPQRVPLSSLIAQRHETAGDDPSATATATAHERSARLRWPKAALQLSDSASTRLLAALSTLAESVVAICGAREGVGTTTVSLAIAHAASRAGLRVVVIDANPVASDLALAVGVGRTTTLAESVERGEDPTASLTRDEETRVAIAVGGGPITPVAARRVLVEFAASSDLVVIDAGAVATSSPLGPPAAWVRAANKATLVSAADDGTGLSDAVAALNADRIAVKGVIENLVPAA